MTPGRYRKRPVVIEAMRLTEENRDDVIAWARVRNGAVMRASRLNERTRKTEQGVAVETMEGRMFAPVGHWIIRGVKGEFYPCEPDVFTVTYEEADGIGGPTTLVKKLEDEIGQLKAALIRIQMHHRYQNDSVGRPRERSYTLRVAAGALGGEP